MSSGYEHTWDTYDNNGYPVDPTLFRLFPCAVTKTMGLYLERKATPAPYPLKNRSGVDTIAAAKRARSTHLGK